MIADYDDDGWPDVFVANDSMPNFLFRTHRTAGASRRSRFVPAWRWRATARRAPAWAPTQATTTATACSTWSSRISISRRTVCIRGLGRQLFAYATPESGIGPPTLPFVGFGVAFFDFDNDTQLDLAIANGHIIDNAPLYRAGATHAQRKLLFRNVAPRRFADVTASAGPGFALEKVGRGLATGDVDNDGDLDLLVTNNGQSADLLRNDGERGNALLVRLVGKQSNRDGVGARLRLTTGTRTQIREVKAGSSYLGQNDLRQHFGLGNDARADRLEVRWPSGRSEVVQDLPANQIITIREGDGVISRLPFAR